MVADFLRRVLLYECCSMFALLFIFAGGPWGEIGIQDLVCSVCIYVCPCRPRPVAVCTAVHHGAHAPLSVLPHWLSPARQSQPCTSREYSETLPTAVVSGDRAYRRWRILQCHASRPKVAFCPSRSHIPPSIDGNLAHCVQKSKTNFSILSSDLQKNPSKANFRATLH